jgi:NhaP-type Na+/H+ or K+/H+ antiporter
LRCFRVFPEVKLDPELVFLIFLPPLLFSAAWNFPWEDFRSNFLPILFLAVGLVFATIVCVAFAAHARMRRRGVISEEIRRRIERDFDMEEERLQRLLARLERE